MCKSLKCHTSPPPNPWGLPPPRPPDYRSIGYVEFPKFQTGTLAELKAPLLSETSPSYNVACEQATYNVENTAGNARRCHSDRQNSSSFHPSNKAEAFIWQNFQPA